MEAASLGACSVSPRGSVEGIISPLSFPHRGQHGNPHLSQETITTDLPHRIMTFLTRAQAFIALPGNTHTYSQHNLVLSLLILMTPSQGSSSVMGGVRYSVCMDVCGCEEHPCVGSLGTLTELCLTWNVSAVSGLSAAANRSGSGGGHVPIFAFRRPWSEVISAISNIIAIPPAFLQLITFVDSVEEVLQHLIHARQQFLALTSRSTSTITSTSTSTSTPSATLNLG